MFFTHIHTKKEKENTPIDINENMDNIYNHKTIVIVKNGNTFPETF